MPTSKTFWLTEKFYELAGESAANLMINIYKDRPDLVRECAAPGAPLKVFVRALALGQSVTAARLEPILIKALQHDGAPALFAKYFNRAINFDLFSFKSENYSEIMKSFDKAKEEDKQKIKHNFDCLRTSLGLKKSSKDKQFWSQSANRILKELNNFISLNMPEILDSTAREQMLSYAPTVENAHRYLAAVAHHNLKDNNFISDPSSKTGILKQKEPYNPITWARFTEILQTALNADKNLSKSDKKIYHKKEDNCIYYGSGQYICNYPRAKNGLIILGESHSVKDFAFIAYDRFGRKVHPITKEYTKAFCRD